MTIKTYTIAAGLIVLGLAGCQSDKQHLKSEASADCGSMCDSRKAEMNEPFFQEEGTERSMTRIMRTQQARGAAADGMLNAAHFDGGKLNNLGELKLDAIIDGTPEGEPVVIFLNLSEGKIADARMESVKEYLGEAEIDAESMKVAIGINPDNSHLSSMSRSGAYEGKDGQINSVGSKLDDTAGKTGEPMTPNLFK